MIVRISRQDRKRNPEDTKGKRYKLISKQTGRVLGYSKTRRDAMKREKQVKYFKSAK